jgi:triphosphoribosyl-dephospho-CoA synthase
VNTKLFQECYQRACLLELQAIKPGNVGYHAAGHGMNVEQFELSAQVSAPALFDIHTTVGERILNAVRATHEAVGDNTNLGIIMLVAPLAHALINLPEHQSLQARLKLVLPALSIGDAVNCYQAINIAQPGGMGEVEAQDVGQTPQVTLIEAMRLAAARDSIAAEYISNYQSIFSYNIEIYKEFMSRWGSETWAATAVYLRQLLRQPDTLIIRKNGLLKAREISDMIAPLADQVLAAADPTRYENALIALDGQLKTSGINPGTTADMTVATLFVAKLEEARGE